VLLPARRYLGAHHSPGGPRDAAQVLQARGFGDEGIFRGILDNATGTTGAGIFAGTLTSVGSNNSLNLATVDLQLPGGQIIVQGFFFGTQSRIVHAITGGTGSYSDAGGEFSLHLPIPGRARHDAHHACR
jgi:hypothetical protein